MDRLLKIGFIRDVYNPAKITSVDPTAGFNYYFEKKKLVELKGIISLDSIYDIAMKAENPDQFKQLYDQLNIEEMLDAHEKTARYHKERQILIDRLVESGYIDIYGDGIGWKKNDIIITLGLYMKCFVVTGIGGEHLFTYNMYTGEVIYKYNIDDWDIATNIICTASNMAEIDKMCQEYMHEKNTD